MLLFGALAVPASAGCEANKNYEARQAYADTLPQKDPTCLGQCLPDPGSALKDCLAEENEDEYEYLDIWSFDTVGMAGVPYAQTMYAYDDGSILNLAPFEFEPASNAISLCQRATVQEWGFNIRGGPFRDWGGGVGTSFTRLNANGQCSSRYPADYCPPEGSEYPFDQATIDVSDYEGISLWARRGPNSQPLLRVLLGDKRTDDDISFLMYEYAPEQPRYCERNKECHCPLNQECTELYGTDLTTPRPYLADEPEAQGEPFYACWDPRLGTPLPWLDWWYRECGDYVCNRPYSAYPTWYNVIPPEPFEPIPTTEAETDPDFRPDPLSYGRSCNSFAFRGGIESSFCYEPGVDPDPHEGSETCGDHWTYPLHLTTEWKFYRIPFTRLLQQGWAKEQPKLELTAASALRLTWDKGFVDFWIDKVSFYRRKKPPEPEGAAGASGN